LKKIILAVGGLVAVAGIGFALYTFVLGGKGNSAEASHEELTPVNIPSKVGPRIVTADRVFNLKSPASNPKYLKMQATIEFQTTDPMWGWVLGGCKGKQPKPSKHAASVTPAVAPASAPMASLDPSIGREPAVPGVAGEAEPICVATEKALLAHFEEELGTGKSVIEDLVTSVVSRHTSDEISSSEGKEKLKREIQAAIEHVMHEPKVLRILFTNFVTQ
jgi:flagellar basal body-associated protein FliL